MADPLISAPGGFVPRVALSFGAPDVAATAVDDAHPLPVALRAATVSYVDRSGTVASGGAAQVLAPAQPARRGFFVQNLSSGDLWISSIGTALADQPALRIAPGQLYEAPAHGVPGSAISVFGATTGQSFAAREW